MEYFVVDLYDYYKVKKPDGAEGKLTCYLTSENQELENGKLHPAMLVLPGGAYAYCSNREAEPVAIKYMSLGFHSFLLNYSVAPICHPTQIVECYMAMNYIRENADKLRVDGDKVSAVGFSAGGHLCSMLGSLEPCEITDKFFRPTTSVKPNAIVVGYPVVTSGKNSHIGSFINLTGNNSELIEKLDILNLVNSNSAPAFIWATYYDNAVPASNAMEMALKYYENKALCSLHVWANGEHGLSLADKTVYLPERYDAVKNATASVPSWIELSFEFLSELNLTL